MISRTLAAAGVAALLSIHPAAAADISGEGAKALKDILTGFLPEEARSSGFINVKPAGDKYQITYDFAKLLKSIDSKDFTISGLAPFSMFAAPVANGMWKLNSESDAKFSVTAKIAEGKPAKIDYSITDM